ncbi:DNA cytosine methyltransferase [Streptomyces sp. NPDC050504]|uniref:DNA cytosine methyltransferase n=1 Tax=Streptomyces sp. NPDC050504 TaxID=3365618 RepID=UPI0037A7C97E
MGLRIGSLCTGYGGLDMAVQAVFGGSLAWVADNDPGAGRILAHRHPGVRNLGDITAVDWHDLEPVDIACGGYPCQPFSLAGRLKGTSDERHLWPDIARALRVLRPQLAIFENVANHLRLGFDQVLRDLARLGFDARWCTLRASDVGAAHQRKRLFVLAWPADSGGQGLAWGRADGPAPDGRRFAAADPVGLGEHRSRTRGAGRDEPAAYRLAAAHAPGIGEREPADPTHPLAAGRDARQMPGGGGGAPAAHADRRGLERDPEPPAGRNALRQRVRQDPDRRDDAPAQPGTDFGEYGPAVARWETVLGRRSPGPVDALGRLNPAFVEWLMGLPAGHVTDVPGLSRTAQLKALGNGVVPQQAVAALRFLTLAALPARTAA